MQISKYKQPRHFLEPKASPNRATERGGACGPLCQTHGRVPWCSLHKQDDETSDGERAHDSRQCPGWGEGFSVEGVSKVLCATQTQERKLGERMNTN